MELCNFDKPKVGTYALVRGNVYSARGAGVLSEPHRALLCMIQIEKGDVP